MSADLCLVYRPTKRDANSLPACMQEYDLNAAEYHTAPLDTQRTRQVLEAIQLAPTQLDGYAEVTALQLPDAPQYTARHMLYTGFRLSGISLRCALTACAQRGEDEPSACRHGCGWASGSSSCSRRASSCWRGCTGWPTPRRRCMTRRLRRPQRCRPTCRRTQRYSLPCWAAQMQQQPALHRLLRRKVLNGGGQCQHRALTLRWLHAGAAQLPGLGHSRAIGPNTVGAC
jgi:hypothetical protein